MRFVRRLPGHRRWRVAVVARAQQTRGRRTRRHCQQLLSQRAELRVHLAEPHAFDQRHAPVHTLVSAVVDPAIATDALDDGPHEYAAARLDLPGGDAAAGRSRAEESEQQLGVGMTVERDRARRARSSMSVRRSLLDLPSRVMPLAVTVSHKSSSARATGSADSH